MSTPSISALFDVTHTFPSLNTIPDYILSNVDFYLGDDKTSLREQLEKTIQSDSALLGQLHRVLLGSQFVTIMLAKVPEVLLTVLDSDLNTPRTCQTYQRELNALNSTVNSVEEWDKTIRQFRHQEMVRIIWRDLNRLAGTLDITEELSSLASVLINATADFHYQLLAERFGIPRNKQGVAQPFIVIGMGKLGAWELNLSSDVDLIFAYPEKGETDGEKKTLSNQEFFTRLGKAVIKSLDQNTVDGFVFRVDMRLRPYGQSGALVSSFDALDVYYQTQGREWERFAMIKSRIISEPVDSKYIKQLEEILRRFTYRKYVDFSAIDALRQLKMMIAREVKRKSLSDNVKLGAGGIREIEFIAQAFQLIRGGRDTELQDRRVVKIIPLLVELEYLPAGTDRKLLSAYYFLRNTEHAIQAFQDKQTQSLPAKQHEQLQLALVMGFPTWEAFWDELEKHRRHVSHEFSSVIADPQGEEGEKEVGLWSDLWMNFSQEEAEALFQKVQIAEYEALAKHLRELRESPPVVAMHKQGRDRLDEFIPLLLEGLAHSDEPALIMSRLMKLIMAVARRSAYLLLLIENPGALKELIVLSEASPWIADRLADHPALLDELLHPSTLYTVPSKADLQQELRQSVLRIDEQDLESQMEALRYFRSAHGLRVAACEVTERLPLMKVSDYLTELAEVILDYALQQAWAQMVHRHGLPGGQETDEPYFIIVGYGKLGGIELGHGSDLDLVFIHDADPQKCSLGDSEGKRSIDNLTFYMRLGQKIIHLLTTNTPSGQVYDIDMRLRPSGNSGLLVSSFNAFEKYQTGSAWTWEHQALVRARCIAGHMPLQKKYEALRHEILCQERDLAVLGKEVVDMRDKMRQHLGSSTEQLDQGLFHLKHDRGAIVDIEFMVQYAVLAWSHKYPALTRYTDNIRILGDLQESELLSSQEVSQLIEAYKAFRSIGHRLALQQNTSHVDASLFEAERNAVQAIWLKLLGE